MNDAPELSRVITLPLLVLYGLGITIGAGIYVLIGQTAAHAGIYAPMSFVLAAVVMAFSAGTFAEFSGRLPQAAGEAVFVKAGFNSEILSLITGGIILLSAVVAAATIALGGTGYIVALTGLPERAVVAVVIALMGLVAIWGVKQSVVFAGIFTIIEVAGLLVIIGAGFWQSPDLLMQIPKVIPPVTDTAAIVAVFTTSLIAFFAFIGFDDVVNLVEETKNPVRTMPLAILITLVVATILYFLVAMVAVLTVPIDALSESSAPISLMFETLTGVSPLAISLIAIVATLNGVIIQIVMASRVLYGLAKKGSLPKWFANVNKHTHTPIFATIIITAISGILATFFPIGKLAEMTTSLILVAFTFVNISLVLLKLRKAAPPAGVYTVRIWVPLFGAISSFALLVGPYFF